MTVTVPESIEPNVVRIAVTHHIRQSYSRAVEPRAMREARQRLVGRWGLFDVDYNDGKPTTGDRCTTVYKFCKL
jgi:hypothetical protein